MHKSEKDKLGKEWIDKLDLSYVSHCFHGKFWNATAFATYQVKNWFY